MSADCPTCDALRDRNERVLAPAITNPAPIGHALVMDEWSAMQSRLRCLARNLRDAAGCALANVRTNMSFVVHERDFARRTEDLAHACTRKVEAERDQLAATLAAVRGADSTNLASARKALAERTRALDEATARADRAEEKLRGIIQVIVPPVKIHVTKPTAWITTKRTFEPFTVTSEELYGPTRPRAIDRTHDEALAIVRFLHKHRTPASIAAIIEHTPLPAERTRDAITYAVTSGWARVIHHLTDLHETTPAGLAAIGARP